jgi:signal transduction histidine kinase/ligand-binding sensor domain-containing protein
VIRRFAILSGLVALTHAVLFALQPGLSPAQYVHTKWTESGGTPLPDISSLAQTSDGYLWVGTRHGLWRFDGFRLSAWASYGGQPSIDGVVYSVAPSGSGGLWIGTPAGLAAIENGKLVDYRARSTLNGVVIALQADSRRGVWVAHAEKQKSELFLLDDSGAMLRSNRGPPLPPVLSFSKRPDGGVLAVTEQGIYTCSADQSSFRCDPERSLLPRNASATLNTEVRSILPDRDGNLWIGTSHHGLYLLTNGRVHHFTRRDGLSNDFVNALIEDREGNVWVGTMGGLDRFRDPKVVRWSTAEGLTGNSISVVYASPTGDLWVAPFGGGLDVLRGGSVRHVIQAGGARRMEILSLFEDRAGVIWAGTTLGLIRIVNDRVEPVPFTKNLEFGTAICIAPGPDDTLWLTDTVRLARLVKNKIVPAGIRPLPQQPIYKLASDRAGRLWIGYHGGGVSVVDRGAVRTFSALDGLGSGSVQAVFEDSRGDMWIGATESLSRCRRGTWTVWTAREGLPAGGVQGLLEDPSGALWILTPGGIAALPASGASGSDKLSLTLYGPGDGIRFRELGGTSNPRITVAPDGHVWFATEDGLATIQPSGIRRNTVPPPVIVEALTIDGKRIASPGENLKIRGRSLELEYTAISLTDAESIRFRYRILPVNSSWVNVGATRRIVFAGLSPGNYRLQLTACNNDGAWNPTGATVAFSIEPRFYQTWLFAILAVAAAGLLTYAFYRMRLRRVQDRFRLILQERTRLARDLHDTLLQGFAGVVYQLDAATRQLDTAPQEGRERLARALDQADQSLREARQAISSMRVPAIENNTLPEAIRRAGAQITEDTAIHFQLETRGKARELPYDVQANLFIIAREAVTNAANHAAPERITVTLSYLPNRVDLLVRDNGKGFEVEGAAKANHWGLAGMRERAEQIGASFTVRSAPGAGTTVELLSPNQTKENARTGSA